MVSRAEIPRIRVVPSDLLWLHPLASYRMSRRCLCAFPISCICSMCSIPCVIACSTSVAQCYCFADAIGLHKVENPAEKPACTLHCYIPPYQSCRCFMEETAKACVTNISFHSVDGKLKQCV